MLPRFNPCLGLSGSRDNRYGLHASLNLFIRSTLQGAGISPSSLFEARSCSSKFARLAYYSTEQRQDEPSRLAVETRHAIMSILHNAGHSNASINKPSPNTYVPRCHVALGACSSESNYNRTVSRISPAGQSTTLGDFCLLARCGLAGSTDHQQRFAATRQANVFVHVSLISAQN